MKIRLDQLLAERGMAESREKAQRLIRAGLVLVGAGERRIEKPGTKIDGDAPIRIKGEQCPYVSRGGFKLQRALERFGLLELGGALALDIGASTGGFTDCMLQHGAAKVWAVDTGRGQLHSRLEADPRVTLLENANARNLAPDWLQGERPAIAAIDVSFISLRLILPPLAGVLAPDGRVIALVKPQFEAGPADVGKGGVVRERAVHRRVLGEVLAFALEGGWALTDACPSPVKGPAGNIEFLYYLVRAGGGLPALDAKAAENAVEQALNEAYSE